MPCQHSVVEPRSSQKLPQSPGSILCSGSLGIATASFGLLGLEQAPDRAQPYRHDAVSGEVPIPWSRLQYLQALAPAGGIDASVSEIADYALLRSGTIR